MTQRVLLLAIGGLLAESVWKRIYRWSNARTVNRNDTWSDEDWPVGTRDEVDAFVERIASLGFTPPVLYRSEHVDCWSMGNVYADALVKADPEYCRQLYTTDHQLIATWVRFTEQIVPDRHAAPETLWLYSRVNEAIAAWGELSERRLIVLVRSVLGGTWTNEEVAESLGVVPEWWNEI